MSQATQTRMVLRLHPVVRYLVNYEIEWIDDGSSGIKWVNCGTGEKTKVCFVCGCHIDDNQKGSVVRIRDKGRYTFCQDCVSKIEYLSTRQTDALPRRFAGNHSGNLS